MRGSAGAFLLSDREKIYIYISKLGRVTAFVKTHINGLIHLERTIEQTTETMPLVPKLLQLLRSKTITSLQELLNI